MESLKEEGNMLSGRRAHSLQRTLALYELATGEIAIFISYESSVYVWNCINYPQCNDYFYRCP